jgi:hypothetical protein
MLTLLVQPKSVERNHYKNEQHGSWAASRSKHAQGEYEVEGKRGKLRWVWGGDSATAIPNVRVDSVKLGANWMHFRFMAAGKNPLIPSADIDFRVAMTVSIASSRLGINAELTGDQFPNAEVMVQDRWGGRRMIQTYETDGGRTFGPFVRLPGEGHRPMSAICICVPVDENGRFK